jgi:GT2 family glycosyltransferase
MSGTAQRPTLSVVIPTYGHRESLARTLRGLAEQTLAADEYEVVVAIDGSEDGTRELVAELGVPYALDALWQPNRGRAAACNAAIQRARGDVLVILDDDMEPAPGLLAAHLEAHPPGSRTCALGAVPIALDSQTPPHAAYVAAKFNRHLLKLSQAGHQFVLRDFYTGNASIRRETLSDVGLFDERFDAYGNEDLELSLRLRKADVGLLYLPDACALQHYDKSFEQLAHDTIAKGRTAVLFAEIHPEAYAELRLSAYHQAPWWWRLPRGALLALTSRRPKTAANVVGLTNWLGRRVKRLTLYHQLVLDYFYWVGARGASS